MLNGIDIAIVKDVVTDKKLNYINVEVEGRGITLKNVQLMVPIAGVVNAQKPGAGFGLVFVPPVGQRVVIGYIDSQKKVAVCLGCVYDETNFAPNIVNKKSPNLYFSYGEEWSLNLDKTKKTMEIKIGSQGKEDVFMINQSSKKTSLTLSDKQTKITIDGNKGSIELAAKQEIKMSVGTSSIQINTQGINIKTNSNLNVKGLNTVLDATSQAKLQGATVIVKGTVQAELQGAVASVKGSGLTKLG